MNFGAAPDGLEQHKPFAAGLADRGRCVCPFHGLPRRGQNVIDELTVLKIFAVYAGCWALGFGMGKAVAWTKKIASIA